MRSEPVATAPGSDCDFDWRRSPALFSIACCAALSRHQLLLLPGFRMPSLVEVRPETKARFRFSDHLRLKRHAPPSKSRPRHSHRSSGRRRSSSPRGHAVPVAAGRESQSLHDPSHSRLQHAREALVAGLEFVKLIARDGDEAPPWTEDSLTRTWTRENEDMESATPAEGRYFIRHCADIENVKIIGAADHVVVAEFQHDLWRRSALPLFP